MLGILHVGFRRRLKRSMIVLQLRSDADTSVGLILPYPLIWSVQLLLSLAPREAYDLISKRYSIHAQHHAAISFSNPAPQARSPYKP